MSLLRRPSKEQGVVHDITPESVGWKYVGFELQMFAQGNTIVGESEGNEVILVVVEGILDAEVEGQSFSSVGERLNVFERNLPHSIYVPINTRWSVTAKTDSVLAICRAPGKASTRQPRLIGPNQVLVAERGVGSNRRIIHNIAMEDQDFADSLLVTEVFTPQGHWSSYPPHRHDEDDFPRITYLEETYYHRLNPPQGFGVQRVFTDDGAVDEIMCVQNHDVVLVPKGYHPCGTPFGYEMYYLNVMAGPRRKWRFQDHPDHAWLHAFQPD